MKYNKRFFKNCFITFYYLVIVLFKLITGLNFTRQSLILLEAETLQFTLMFSDAEFK